MTRDTIVMAYPLMGMSGAFVKHAPLGLLYACIEVLKLWLRMFEEYKRTGEWAPPE